LVISENTGLSITTALTLFIILDYRLLIKAFRKLQHEHDDIGISNEGWEKLMELGLTPTINKVDPLDFKKAF